VAKIGERKLGVYQNPQDGTREEHFPFGRFWSAARDRMHINLRPADPLQLCAFMIQQQHPI
jgi:hypothetical protein